MAASTKAARQKQVATKATTKARQEKDAKAAPKNAKSSQKAKAEPAPAPAPKKAEAAAKLQKAFGAINPRTGKPLTRQLQIAHAVASVVANETLNVRQIADRLSQYGISEKEVQKRFEFERDVRGRMGLDSKGRVVYTKAQPNWRTSNVDGSAK